MTINKSQGQTFQHVGIHLNNAPFSQGQLYVALSRARKQANVKVFIRHNKGQQGELYEDDKGIYAQLFSELLPPAPANMVLENG